MLAAIIAGDPVGKEVTDINLMDNTGILYARRQCFPHAVHNVVNADGNPVSGL